MHSISLFAYFFKVAVECFAAEIVVVDDLVQGSEVHGIFPDKLSCFLFIYADGTGYFVE